MFHNNLGAYAEVINQAVSDLLTNLQHAAQTGEQIDVHQQLGRMTMVLLHLGEIIYCSAHCTGSIHAMPCDANISPLW